MNLNDKPLTHYLERKAHDEPLQVTLERGTACGLREPSHATLMLRDRDGNIRTTCEPCRKRVLELVRERLAGTRYLP
jgi:hypothetical protein